MDGLLIPFTHGAVSFWDGTWFTIVAGEKNVVSRKRDLKVFVPLRPFNAIERLAAVRKPQNGDRSW